MNKQNKVEDSALILRTHLKIGYKDLIRGCQGMFVTTELGPTGRTWIRATCLDLAGKRHKASVEFPNSYTGVVQNCNGKLTAGGCG